MQLLIEYRASLLACAVVKVAGDDRMLLYQFPRMRTRFFQAIEYPARLGRLVREDFSIGAPGIACLEMLVAYGILFRLHLAHPYFHRPIFFDGRITGIYLVKCRKIAVVNFDFPIRHGIKLSLFRASAKAFSASPRLRGKNCSSPCLGASVVKTPYLAAIIKPSHARK